MGLVFGAADRAILDRPKAFQAAPAGQVFSVEQRLESVGRLRLIGRGRSNRGKLGAYDKQGDGENVANVVHFMVVLLRWAVLRWDLEIGSAKRQFLDCRLGRTSVDCGRAGGGLQATAATISLFWLSGKVPRAASRSRRHPVTIMPVLMVVSRPPDINLRHSPVLKMRKNDWLAVMASCASRTSYASEGCLLATRFFGGSRVITRKLFIAIVLRKPAALPSGWRFSIFTWLPRSRKRRRKKRARASRSNSLRWRAFWHEAASRRCNMAARLGTKSWPSGATAAAPTTTLCSWIARAESSLRATGESRRAAILSLWRCFIQAPLGDTSMIPFTER